MQQNAFNLLQRTPPECYPHFCIIEDGSTLIDALSIPTSKYCLGMQLRSEEAHKIYMQPLLTKFKYPNPQVNGQMQEL